MVPLRVAVREILGDGATQRSFAEEDHLAHSLFIDRPDESLAVDEPVEGIGQTSDDLHLPFRVRIWHRSPEVHTSAEMLDHEQDVERHRSA